MSALKKPSSTKLSSIKSCKKSSNITNKNISQLENTRNRLKYDSSSLLTPKQKTEKHFEIKRSINESNESNFSKFSKPSYGNNLRVPHPRSTLAAFRSTNNGEVKRSYSTVGKSKLGLRMNGGGNISEIISPDKTHQNKKSIQDINSTKHQSSKRGMTLTSYSKLRNDIKKRKTDSISNSTENFEPSSLLATPQRNTLALSSGLTSMRQQRKMAKEKLEDLVRERDLFGNLEEIKEMRSTLQPAGKTSNQNSHLNKDEYQDIDMCPFDKTDDKQSQSSETEFDRDMNEMEGVSRSSMPDNIVRYDSGSIIDSNATDTSIVMKQSILMSENDLETINELDGTINYQIDCTTN